MIRKFITYHFYKKYQMKKTDKCTILQIIMVLIFLTSCAKEFNDTPIIIPSDTNNKSQEVSIDLKTPNQYALQTRSLTNDEEKAIKNAYIFAFKTGVLSYVKKADIIDNGQKIKAKLKSSDNSSDTYKLVVLTNAHEFIYPLVNSDLEGLNGSTYNEVQERLNETGITTAMYSSGGSIVMWGELPYEEINSSNSNFSIYLVRSVARIDVGTGATSYDPQNMQATWGGLANFILEGVYVYKPNDAYSFIPIAANFDDTEKKAVNPSPIGTKSASPLYYDVNGGIALVRHIYVPEADVKMGSSGTSGDSNHTNRMAIVVKGSYNGNISSYYRLDFINNEKALTNVLRNHLYQFNIKSVSGNGYSNPDDAYKSLATNMDVEVLEWNDGAIGEIIFDAQYMLGVNKPTFTFPKHQQTALDTDNKLVITTDVPEGWSIEKIADENGVEANATWLTLSKYTGIANMNAIVDLLIEKNNTNTERKAYIYITAGRLKYIVEVIQTPHAAYIPMKTLLTIGGSPDDYGYNFSGTAASNRLIKAFTNFGTTPVSIVKTEGFSIIDGGQNPSATQMYEWLINNPVDIVVIGYDNSNISTTIAGYYAQYLANGGVVIAFQDRTDKSVSGNLLNAVLGNNISVAYATGAGSVYKFSNLDDEVLNGPFGDIRGLQWGEDASTTVRISGIDTYLVDILSDDKDISSSGSNGTGSVTGFKHKTLNFIWFGDGGFVSNGCSGHANCPFMLDTNNFPIAKPGYGRGSSKYLVYNAVLTANAFAWALKQADKD